MKLIKTLTTFAVAVSIMAAAAQAKDISVVVHAPEGGNVFKQSQMLADSLTRAGYTVDVVKAGNCVNMKNFLENNPTKPAVFLYSDVTYNEDVAKSCNLQPNKDNFITLAFFRINAVCSSTAVHSTSDAALALLNSNKAFTVASSTSTPVSIIETMGTALDKKVTMVPYSGTSGSVRGVLGRDADFWYGGLTASIVENKELFCWANTGDTKIGTMEPLKTLMPKYTNASFGSYWFVQGYGMDAATKKIVKQDLEAAFAGDDWNKFITKSYMVPGKDLKKFKVDDVFENIKRMK